MACHEIAALRLGLMGVLGREDEAERRHELAELGQEGNEPGPIHELCAAKDLRRLQRSYEVAVSELEARVSATDSAHPKLAYLRTLVVLTKQVELDLQGQIDGLTRFYRDLDQIHDFVHEIYPAP
jgi:hypothetical protein